MTSLGASAFSLLPSPGTSIPLQVIRAATIVSLVLSFSGCAQERDPGSTWSPANHTQPAQATQSAAPAAPAVANEEAQARAVAALWRQQCAGCHGTEGAGDGAQAPGPMQDLGDPEWQSSHSDEDIARVVALGEGQMPGFANRLPAQNIALLVMHVRSLRRAQTPEQPGQTP